jgi:ApbE superfamily uncharacterized protein (UPF0280 family)
MRSIYDIYERKRYRNRIRLDRAVSFEVEVRETNLHIQAQGDLTAKAKDSVFRYRYQVEEYLRRHPAFREASAPIEIHASAPEIVRYTDLAVRAAGVAPMSCMSGAMADFVGRDLSSDSLDLVVVSGGDAFIKASSSLEVGLYAKGSPLHERLILALPAYENIYGVSTYVPGHGIHAVTVISRTACWASAFAGDLGRRLVGGESSRAALDRAAQYTDVGGIIIIAGEKVFVGGDLVLRSAPDAPFRRAGSADS